jgi:hypothetical protein
MTPLEPIEPASAAAATKNDPGGTRGIGRRTVLQSLVGGVGATIALPLAEAHPVQQHLNDHGLVAQADAKASKAAYKPEFLDDHQLQTFEVLAERIVPRSTEARVAPFVDQLLSVDSQASQRSFLGSLGAFDMFASQRHGKPWKALTPAQQDELLTAASTAEPGGSLPGGGDPRRPFPSVRTGKATMRDHFENLKGWISGAFYSSEIGMRELGWTGEMFFQSLPGCEHPGGHGG